MPYNLSRMGTDVYVPFLKTLLDIALVLVRPVNLELWYQHVTTQITDRAGTHTNLPLVGEPSP